MTEATPPPVPPPLSTPRRISWRRVRVYSWSILLVLGIYLFWGAVLFRVQPKRAVDGVLAHLPFPSGVGSARWLDANRLELHDLHIGTFFYAYSVIVTASLPDLMRHHVTGIEIHGMQLSLKKLDDALSRNGSGKPGAGLDWTITKLAIFKSTVMLDNIAADVPSIPIQLGVVHPLVLNYIKLKKPDASPAMTRERTVDIENVNIDSPDVLSGPVLSFPLIRVHFTYTELWHHRIREIEVVRPVLHLGQDLFLFSDEFKKERKGVTPRGVDAPWEVGHFAVEYGQLALNVFGRPTAQFPFFFDTQVDNIRLDQLDKISARSTVAIRRMDRYYPDYKIRIVNLHGKLEFSIPPGDANANNVVPTVFIDELAWNGIAATNVQTSATFDSTGIYGKLTGDCEQGKLAGNFAVYYTKGFTWNASFVADKVDCGPIAKRVADKYFNLTGTLDGKIVVQGRTTEILSCQGTLKLPRPGVLKIPSVDKLLTRLPATAGAFQRDALKIALSAFETYPYTRGDLEIDYKPQGGTGTFKLDGPNGTRRFATYWHPYDSSKIAKTNDNR